MYKLFSIVVLTFSFNLYSQQSENLPQKCKAVAEKKMEDVFEYSNKRVILEQITKSTLVDELLNERRGEIFFPEEELVKIESFVTKENEAEVYYIPDALDMGIYIVITDKNCELFWNDFLIER